MAKKVIEKKVIERIVMKMLRWLLVLMISVSSLTAMGAQPPLQGQPADQAEPIFFTPYRVALLQLIETLLHIPYIATIDSTDPVAIKASAALAFVGNDFRLVKQLLTTRQDVTVLRMLLTAAPKVLGYLLAAWYDMARMQQAECIAKDNKNDAKLLTQFRVNQEVLLAIEIILRLLVVAASYDDSACDSWMQWGVGQVADWVGLWRLLSRYFTILLVLDRLEFTMLTQPRQRGGVVRAVAPSKDEVFVQDLAVFADIVQLPVRGDD
jgi:hypothetical protein